MRGPTNALATVLLVAGLYAYLSAGEPERGAPSAAPAPAASPPPRPPIPAATPAPPRLFRAGSKKSLMFGMGSSFVLFFAGTVMADAAVLVGPASALVVTAGLAYKMYQRYQETGKLVPAGALAGVAALYSVGYVAALVL